MGSGAIWMQAAAGAASSALGIGLQRIGANYDRRQQLRTQEGLTEIQKQAEKEMMDYQQQKELEMWEKTGYGAQTKQMNEAGINPALMYGMGGGGSQTIGHGGSPGISGGTAQYQNTTAMGMQAGMQMALLASQKRVLDTQADKNEAEAAKTSGVDTELTKSQNESVLQGVDNLRQDYQLKKLDITLKNIQNYEQQSSQEDRLDYIEYQTKIAIKQFNILANDNKISDSTIQDNIQRIKAEAVGATLHNILTQSQTDKTKSDIQVNTEQMRKIANDIMLNWDKLSNENKAIEIQKQLMQWNTDPNRHAIDQAVQTLNNLLFTHGFKQ